MRKEKINSDAGTGKRALEEPNQKGIFIAREGISYKELIQHNFGVYESNVSSIDQHVEGTGGKRVNLKS